MLPPPAHPDAAAAAAHHSAVVALRARAPYPILSAASERASERVVREGRRSEQSVATVVAKIEEFLVSGEN
jgi:hypothetical protein